MRLIKKAPFIISSVCVLSACVVIIESFQISNQVNTHNKRSFSSLSSYCIDSVKSLFPGPKKRWNSLSDLFYLNNNKEFSYETYASFKKLYLDESIELELIEKNPESLLAYLESISLKAGIKSSIKADLISTSSRREIASLIESIDIESEDGLKEFSAKIYQSLLGEKYQFVDIANTDKTFKDLSYRIIQEDLSRYGLEIMTSKYDLFKKDKGLFKRITNSKVIKSLLKKSVYLPSLMGYLPPIKAFSIPEKYLEIIISKGMSERLFEEIISDLNNQGILNYQNTIRYNVFRRYYNIGLTLVLSYVTLEAIIERDRSIREDEKHLSESVIEMALKLDKANTAKTEIISELSETEVIDENISRQCRRFYRCLRYASKEVNRELTKNDKSFIDCKERRDPSDLCKVNSPD